MTTPFIIAALVGAIVAVASIRALAPWLERYALARPNARSSHVAPTPQGGGIAVLLGVLAAIVVAPLLATVPLRPAEILALGAAALLLAAVGVCDDVRPLPVAPRLLLQTVAVTVVVHAAGPDVRLLPEAVPLLAERALVVFAGVWFVNLVNFMDGIDWMMVAETVPLTGAIVIFSIAGLMPPDVGLVAAGLLGGMLGFAPFNFPVARLFLGDVGSLPIGLLMAWLLYRLADTGAITAAILLALYFCADATVTLIRRAVSREPLWQAHRSHFYQRATANSFSTLAVVGHVLALNAALAALAAATFLWRTPRAQTALLVVGSVAVALVLWRFSRARR